MNNQRKVCAEFFHDDLNCQHVKVVQEHGYYPVTIFQAKVKDGLPDLSTMHNVRTRVDETCFCAYCTHPSLSVEKFVGSVEPYCTCYAPNDCPELQQKPKTSTSKLSLWEKAKKLFKR